MRAPMNGLSSTSADREKGFPQPSSGERQRPHLTPAEIFLLQHPENPHLGMVLVTLLDLTLRGYLVLESVGYPQNTDQWKQRGWWRRLSRPLTGLLPHERWLLENLFPRPNAVLDIHHLLQINQTLVAEFVRQVDAQLRAKSPEWQELFPWLKPTGFKAQVRDWILILMILLLVIGWVVLGGVVEDVLLVWTASAPRWLQKGAELVAFFVMCAGLLFAILVPVVLWWRWGGRRLQRLRKGLPLEYWLQLEEQDPKTWWSTHAYLDEDQVLEFLQTHLAHLGAVDVTGLVGPVVGDWLQAAGRHFPQLTLPWWRIYAPPLEGELYPWSEALALPAGDALIALGSTLTFEPMMRHIRLPKRTLRQWQAMGSAMLKVLEQTQDELASVAQRLQHALSREEPGVRLVQVQPEEILRLYLPGRVPVWFQQVRRWVVGLAVALAVGWGVVFVGFMVVLWWYEVPSWGFIPWLPWWVELGLFLGGVYSWLSWSVAIWFPRTPDELPRKLGRLFLELGVIALLLAFCLALLLGLLLADILPALTYPRHLALREQGQGQVLELQGALLALDIWDDGDDTTFWLTLDLPQLEVMSLGIKAYTLPEETIRCLQELRTPAAVEGRGVATTAGMELEWLVLSDGTRSCELRR